MFWLAAVSNLLKVQLVVSEVDFNNTGRFNPRAQYVILRRRVITLAEALQVFQKATNKYVYNIKMG